MKEEGGKKHLSVEKKGANTQTKLNIKSGKRRKKKIL